MIDEQKFFDQSVKSNSEHLRGHFKEMITLLVVYESKMIAIDLSKQHALDADSS